MNEITDLNSAGKMLIGDIPSPFRSIEHGLIRYAAGRSPGVTPGHRTKEGKCYRIFDPSRKFSAISVNSSHLRISGLAWIRVKLR
jgi:hypothetical protein